MLVNKSNQDVRGGEKYTLNGDDNKLLLAGECDAVVEMIINECGW